jgi:hypothetical protein
MTEESSHGFKGLFRDLPIRTQKNENTQDIVLKVWGSYISSWGYTVSDSKMINEECIWKAM